VQAPAGNFNSLIYLVTIINFKAMNVPKLNLFIVDHNEPRATSLKNYLYSKFGDKVSIRTSLNSFRNLNEKIHLVIVDYDLKNTQELKILSDIKVTNPATEIIMLTNNEESMEPSTDLVKSGINNHVIRNNYVLKKISLMINKIITQPIKYVIREFGVPTFMIIFFTTFILMAITVSIVLTLSH
jgi:response regulator RpfG family c-di-GMP phosphodiesterase